jgi:acetylornithine/succinyldiaminopimelate/putrescine aminotransferase
MWSADRAQIAYAERLTEALPAKLTAVGRATGGTEANEMAFKMARAKTGRPRIVGIRDTYHGQSFASIAAGFRPEFVKSIAPLVPYFSQLEYPGSLDEFKVALEAELAAGDVAAVLTEAGIVTGWGSTSVAPSGYLRAMREITEKHGTLLILDEVGTGFSRAGKLFALEIDDVEPDFLTLAKGISNGAAPIGAVVTTAAIADATYAKAVLTSTFGWTPLSCAAADKTLEIHQRDRIWEKAATDGEYVQKVLRAQLQDLPHVKQVRGIGMEIGIELADADLCKSVVKEALKAGLHLAETGESTLQLMPPLTINRSTLDEGLRYPSQRNNKAGVDKSLDPRQFPT